ncbi:MAG: DinB family protein [Sphingobacteriales bacterium]|nr:DinB family protein [Sphingobacteriales bacterium]
MISIQLAKQLGYLQRLLLQLSGEQYTKPVRHLDQSTVGGHSRHIIEILQCVLKGYEPGRVDYIRRTRDLRLETSRETALQAIDELVQAAARPDKTLSLVVAAQTGGAYGEITTTYNREMAYVLEHTIHHLALIKVALVEMNLNLVNNEFGVAYSTLLYKQSAGKKAEPESVAADTIIA